MPKAGKKKHIVGGFFFGGDEKKREKGEGIRYRRKESYFLYPNFTHFESLKIFKNVSFHIEFLKLVGKSEFSCMINSKKSEF